MLIEIANEHARRSCTRWNKGFPEFLHRLSRVYHRFRYQRLAELDWTFNLKHRELENRYKHGEMRIDTYPWPYFDPEFANWDESDESDDYSLISDQSGCVVKHSTSYVAWKIFEATGCWPKKRSKTRMDARDWEKFLAEAGYTKCAIGGPFDGRHYVGIRKENLDEFGEVVWFEKRNSNKIGGVFVSTYENKKHCFKEVNAFKYIWIQID